METKFYYYFKCFLISETVRAMRPLALEVSAHLIFSICAEWSEWAEVSNEAICGKKVLRRTCENCFGERTLIEEKLSISKNVEQGK